MRVWRYILGVGAGVGMLASGAAGQVIHIEKQAAVEMHQDVRLGDVARVSGTDSRTAESLANLVILPDVREGRTMRAEVVLMAVISQIGPGKVADHLQVSGSATCELTLGGAAKKTTVSAGTAGLPVMAMAAPAAAMASAKNFPAVVPAVKETQPVTLARQVILELQQDLGVGAEDLRVSFNTANPLLDQVAPEGKRWVLRPLARTLLGTVQFEAQLVEGVRVVQKFNLQIQVLRRQRVLTALAPLSRGDVVTPEHFRSTEVWLDRSMPTFFQNEKDAVGLEAIRSIDVGTTLDERDFKPVDMARRGDAVAVFFVHGNLKVQMKGTAMQDGKMHESIPVKNDSTNETYQATLIGKRQAVVGGPLDESQEKQLREAR